MPVRKPSQRQRGQLPRGRMLERQDMNEHSTFKVGSVYYLSIRLPFLRLMRSKLPRLFCAGRMVLQGILYHPL